MRAPQQRLVVTRATDATSLDPARVTDFESLEVARHIFSNLVRFAPGTLRIEPDLATRWTANDTSTTWVFDLAPGRSFHDGTPVDAAAVVFSFARQIDPEHPAHAGEYPWQGAFRVIHQVVAESPTRVRFELDRPYAPFLANLAMPPAAIVSPTAVSAAHDEFGRRPVGSGPFRFVSWVPGDRITLERVAAADGRPRFLVFETVRESAQRREALESGAADVDRQLAPEDVPFVRLHPELVVGNAPAATVVYLAFNTARSPWDDVRVRRAVAYAIRRDAIVKYLYQGQAVLAVGPLPPELPSARTDLATPVFDPTRARELLAEAGVRFDPADPVTLYAPATPRLYLPAPDRLAVAVRASLEAVGIPVRIMSNDPREHARAIKHGEHDLALHGWVGDNGDPDNFLYTLLHADGAVSGGQNVAQWQHEAFSTVVHGAQRVADPTTRDRLYFEAQAIFARELPWVPLAHPRLLFATRADVRGVTFQPTGLADLTDVSIVGVR